MSAAVQTDNLPPRLLSKGERDTWRQGQSIETAQARPGVMREGDACRKNLAPCSPRPCEQRAIGTLGWCTEAAV